MRVAVTGASGRLGQALVAALADAAFSGPAGPLAWDRAAFDLDAPERLAEEESRLARVVEIQGRHDPGYRKDVPEDEERNEHPDLPGAQVPLLRPQPGP